MEPPPTPRSVVFLAASVAPLSLSAPPPPLQDCIVCQELFAVGATLVRLPCGHLYHEVHTYVHMLTNTCLLFDPKEEASTPLWCFSRTF